jgi:hypothetical protein
LISKELVIVKNYWKMLNVQKNTSLPENEWPSLVFVSDVTHDNSSPLAGSPAYTIQSPEGSPIMEQNNEARVEMEEEVNVEEELRFNLRKSSSDKDSIMDKAINRMKKRNFEGNFEPEHLQSTNYFPVMANT